LQALSELLSEHGVVYSLSKMTPLDRGPAVREYSIYAALARHLPSLGERITKETGPGHLSDKIDLFPEVLSQDTLEDFLAKNTTSYSLDRTTVEKLGIELVSDGPSLTVSRVGVNREATQALIYASWYVTPLAADGGYYLFWSSPRKVDTGLSF